MTEKDGYYYGRGVVDDKSMAAAFVAALVRMRLEGFRPERDIILMLEADEEILDRNEMGIRWLLRNHRELIDAEFALNEGAGVTLRDGRPQRVGLQTTSVATQLEGGIAANALPQRARATINCRVLPGESVPEVRRTLARVLADERITITPSHEPVTSAPSPLSREILAPIEQIAAEFWPGAPVVPVMSTGATDGSFLRNAGIPTYGHSGMTLEASDAVRIHGKDERIAVQSYHQGAEYLYRLVKQLAAPARQRQLKRERPAGLQPLRRRRGKPPGSPGTSASPTAGRPCLLPSNFQLAPHAPFARSRLRLARTDATKAPA